MNQINPMSRFFSALLLLCGWLDSALLAQVAPADGVYDDTHALSEPSRVVLTREIQQVGPALGVRFWLRADTFLGDGQTIKALARETRLQWSGEADAVLMAYERSKDALHLSISPGLWQRYPSARLAQLSQQCGLIMNDRSKTVESRLRDAMLVILRSFAQLEKDRLRSAAILGPAHQTLAMTFAIGLLVAGLLALVLGGIVRRRDVKAAWQSYFPSVQVAVRLGANCGGSVRALSTMAVSDL